MGGLPLHPVIVHYPLAMAALMPVLATLFVLLIRQRKIGKKAWWFVVALQVVNLAFTKVAEHYGEKDEDQIEQVVDYAMLENHEEWGERLLQAELVATVVAGVSTVPLVWPWAAYIYIGTKLASGYVAFEAGHSGGELVYKGGAGSAYD